MNTQQISKALGWFSIGLGVAQLVAPRRLGRSIGVGNHDMIMRMCAAREIACGIGLLASQRQRPIWLWSRVIGDVADLALLGSSFASKNRQAARLRIAAAAAAVAGVTAADLLSARQATRERNGTYHPKPSAERADHVHRSITIGLPPSEVYAFWRKLENLPRFMENLVSVTELDARRSRWVAKGPAGKNVEWDAEIINEEPGSLIAWRSLPGAQIEQAGTVRFQAAPGGRGTIVRVKMQYHPPGGALGRKIAHLFGRAPEQQMVSDLHRFKQLLETGEIARTQGQSAGRETSTSKRYDDVAKRLVSV